MRWEGCALNKVFRVYAAHGWNREMELELPASDYEMLDLMERLRLKPDKLPCLEISEYHAFGFLESCIHDLPDVYQLNALAKKLSGLDGRQCTAFAGLLTMEREKTQFVPIARMIDLAYSTDQCHVLGDALNDAQLGRFLAENDFLPEAEKLSGEAFELLDFERIGREHRQAEGGVFTSSGYVERHDEVLEASKTLDVMPHKPDYLFRVGIIHHPDAVPEGGSRQTVYLELPATVEQWQKAEDELGGLGWLGTVMDSFDGVIPAVGDMLLSTEDLPDLNGLAQRLAELEPKALTAYKALLDATDCRDIQNAGTLLDSLDICIFSPQYSSPVDVAKGELSVVLCEQDAAVLLPHLNLYQYGQALIERDGAALTPYGMIERVDHQPVQAMEQKPEGMVMT